SNRRRSRPGRAGPHTPRWWPGTGSRLRPDPGASSWLANPEGVGERLELVWRGSDHVDQGHGAFTVRGFQFVAQFFEQGRGRGPAVAARLVAGGQPRPLQSLEVGGDQGTAGAQLADQLVRRPAPRGRALQEQQELQRPHRADVLAYERQKILGDRQCWGFPSADRKLGNLVVRSRAGHLRRLTRTLCASYARSCRAAPAEHLREP